MKITRDGKEYELTDNELVQAWNEIEDRNLRYDIKDEFDAIAEDYEEFKKYYLTHKAEMQEMMDDAFDRCKFKDEMYMGFSVEDVVWEVIEDYDELGEMFK